ncbi:hypothetical protein [uncultured Rikenella sp.]|uniref:hypothetical protein n=1 Tax=uncultured Rikenella sp. TaxID=368003 RepID=UPI00263A0D99|nr:hypothetical protein [uncultured Rikenella sp.]
MLSGTGYYGYSWSSGVDGTDGIYLRFGVTYHNRNHKGSRAHGFQLRCLLE